jgi:hypothetical protein
MATMILNTLPRSERDSQNRGLRGFRTEVDAFFRDCMQHAVAEGSRVRTFGSLQSDRAVTRHMDDGESPGVGLRPLSTRHIEPSTRATIGFGRKIARFILTASLALVLLAGNAALQAAIHVYVWRLAG